MPGRERASPVKKLSAGVIHARARPLRCELQRLVNNDAINEGFRAEQACLACARVLSRPTDQVERGGDSARCVKASALADVSTDSQAGLIFAVLSKFARRVSVGGD